MSPRPVLVESPPLAETDASPRAQVEPSSTDIYFSADVETDGPIPGPFSILSFALVYAGQYDGTRFRRPDGYGLTFYRELRPEAAFVAQTTDEILRIYERFLETTSEPEMELVRRFVDASEARQLVPEATQLGKAMYDLLATLGDDSDFYRLLVV